MGVSACATCDGFFYRKKDVIVVGGGDTACEEALYLASICHKVYMVVRKNYLRASKHMQQRVMDTPNIEVLFGYNTMEVLGDDNGVTALGYAMSRGLNGCGCLWIFVAIGHTPNTALFAGALDLDDEGYIRTAPVGCHEYRRGVCRGGCAGSAFPPGDYGRIGLYGGDRSRTLFVDGGLMKNEPMEVNPQTIFAIQSEAEFERVALEVFRYQARCCEPYGAYLRLLGSIRPK